MKKSPKTKKPKKKSTVKVATTTKEVAVQEAPHILTSSFSSFADVKKPFCGYGLVNNWYRLNANTIMDLLVENNVHCLAFEFFPWGGARYNPFPYVGDLLVKFEEFITAAASHKVILYVILVSANVGSGKFGDLGYKLTTYSSYIRTAQDQFAIWMNQYPFIYVTPIGEGKNETIDRPIQDYCVKKMPNYQLVNNWKSRPVSKGDCGHFCVYPSSTLSEPPSNHGWVVSGHTLLIRELNGGSLYGTANETKTRAYARKLARRGVPFIYYHFNNEGTTDIKAIRATGTGYAQGR